MNSALPISRSPGELTLSDKIDAIATHKYLALPVFIGVMALVFFITFGPLGNWLTEGLDGLIGRFTEWARGALTGVNASPWAVSLLCDGIIAGVGSIVSFFPQILILFLFLSILEDSGYMARAAFIMDKLLHKTGCPAALSFPCSWVLAARCLVSWPPAHWKTNGIAA